MSSSAAVLSLLAGFQQVDQVDEYNGCVIHIGRALDGRVQPLLSECHWPDVSPDDVRTVLLRYDAYGDFIDVIKEIRVLRDETPRSTLVWHFSKPGFGLAPRESEVWMERMLDGAWSLLWRTASEPFVARQGSVVMPRNEGVWTVASASGGGVEVKQLVLVDPGGSVPAFVVNWFSTCGIKEELVRLRQLARDVTP
jgi:hypothetical protein